MICELCCKIADNIISVCWIEPSHHYYMRIFQESLESNCSIIDYNVKPSYMIR